MDNLLDASPMKKQKEEAKILVNKWEKTGLLDGLNEDFQKGGMATLLENQARQLISENSSTGGGAATSGANTAAAGSEEWSGVALPLVRRIFGEIAAQEFVSVQPMNLPSGLVFYLDFKYGKTTAGTNAEGFGVSAAGTVPGGGVSSMGGKTGPNSPIGSSAPYGVGGLYGEGRYDYSINSKTANFGASPANNTVSASGHFNSASATYKDINFNQEFSSSLAASQLIKLTMSTKGLTRPDTKSVRSWNLSGSAFSAGSSSLPQFTKFDSVNENVIFIVSSSALAGAFGALHDAADAGLALIYSEQPTEAVRGDFEDGTGDANADTLAIPEVDLQLKSQAIVAKTRKLKAVWTPELAQDLNAYHSVDAEAELTSMLSEYISMEIDLEILDMLISDAQTTAYWSATPGEDYNGSGTNETGWDITTFYGTRFEWFQTLVQKITTVSNEIHRLTLRGGANFVVVSPKVATIFESLPGYNSTPGTDASATQFAMGVSKVGAIDSRYTVYKNPYMTENTILVGFRGSNFLETGAVYSPYVPLIMTPLVYDPSDFTPRKGVMTRYAKKMIRPEFYGKVFCKDLHLV